MKPSFIVQSIPLRVIDVLHNLLGRNEIFTDISFATGNRGFCKPYKIQSAVIEAIPIVNKYAISELCSTLTHKVYTKSRFLIKPVLSG